jgi:hypothetical protein
MKSVLLIAASPLLAMLLSGCPDMFGSRMVPGGFQITDIRCTRAIDFQANKISLPSMDFEVPITKTTTGPSVTIKVGTGAIDPQTLRTASDLIQEFDSAQYSTCQTMASVTSDDAKIQLNDRLQQQQLALAKLANGLASSSTPQQADAVVAQAEKDKSTVLAHS